MLPGYPSIAAQVDFGEQIFVAILGVTDLQLSKVCQVVHVPTEEDGAEAEAILGDGEEFLLGDELAAKDAINVNTGKLYLSVLFKGFGKIVKGESV